MKESQVQQQRFQQAMDAFEGISSLQQQQQQHSQQATQLGDTLSPLGGESSTSGLHYLDSLSLSLSESTMGNNSKTMKRLNSENSAAANAAAPSIGGTIEIDTDGFPISPTSLNSEELHGAKSADAVEQEQQQMMLMLQRSATHPQAPTPAAVSSSSSLQDLQHKKIKVSTDVQQLQQYFSTLDTSVTAVRAQNDRTRSKAVQLLDSKGKLIIQDVNTSTTATNTGELAAKSEVPSQVPTEIASNTARYVATQSNLMARRMMNNTASAGTEDDSKMKKKLSMMGPLLTVKTVPTPTNNASKSMPQLLTPVTTAQPMDSNTNSNSSSNNKPPPPSSSKDAAMARMKLAATPAGENGVGSSMFTPMNSGSNGGNGNGHDHQDTPGWDPTATTVTNDQLESVLATPIPTKEEEEGEPQRQKDELGDGNNDGLINISTEIDLPITPSMEPILDRVRSDEIAEQEDHDEQEEDVEDKKQDVSMVSSTCDPKDDTVDTEGGGDGNADEFMADANLLEAVVKPSPPKSTSPPSSAKSNNSLNSSGSSSKDDIPTLDEVTNFMSQLKQLRHDPSNNSTNNKKSTKKSSSLANEKQEFTTKRSKSSPIQGMDFMPAAPESDVILKEENIEFNKSLLQRKEKLRQHKLQSDRKKKEFDQRLKSIRSRVYDDIAAGGPDDESKGTSMMPGVDKTPPPRATGRTPLKGLPATPADRIIERNDDDDNGSCFPTDEKPFDSGPRAAVQQQPISLFSPMAPAARWSGGLARWNSNTPSPQQQHQDQQQQAHAKELPSPQKKLNIAIDADDFSFRPPYIAGGGGKAMNIPISPIVATSSSAAAALDSSEKKEQPDNANKFSFASSPLRAIEEAPSRAKFFLNSPGSTLLATIENAASNAVAAASSKSKRSQSEPPSNNRSALTISTKEEPMPQREPSPSATNDEKATEHAKSLQEQQPAALSPALSDMSEGDKGAGGFGFTMRTFDNMRGDKSILSKSSSKFVELGLSNPTMDPPDEEDDFEESESLLGVEIKGSKKKKKKRRKSPRSKASRATSFDPVVEELSHDGNSKCSTHDDNVSEEEAKTTRKPLDPDGLDWEELQAKKSEEVITSKPQSHTKLIPACETNVSVNPKQSTILDIVPEANDDENENPEFIEVMDRVKTCLTPRTTNEGMEILNSKAFLTPRSVAGTSRFNFGGKTQVVSSSKSIHDLRCKFESEESVTSTSVSAARKESPKRNGAAVIKSEGGTFTRSKSVPRAMVEGQDRGDSPKKGALSSSELKSRFEPKKNGTSSAVRFKPSQKETWQSKNKSQGVGVGTAVFKQYGGKTMQETMPQDMQLVKSKSDNLAIQGPSSGEKNDIELINSNSSEIMSIRELRSKFESEKKTGVAKQLEAYQKSARGNNNREQLNQKSKALATAGRSTMIGSGVYLKDRELQAMSSLGSETLETAESTLNKVDSNEAPTIGDSTLGDGTLDTKKILRYAKRIEQRMVEPQDSEETESVNSFGNRIDKKDTLSSKENYLRESKSSGTENNQGDNFSGFSPVRMRRKAYESNKKQGTFTQSHSYQQSSTPERKRATSQKNITPAPEVAPACVVNASIEDESPAATASFVKDRIAGWGSKKSASAQKKALLKEQHPSQTQQQSASSRANMMNRSQNKVSQVQQLQSATPPPRTVSMNRTTETPSPLWGFAHQNNNNKPVYGNQNGSPHVVGHRQPNTRISPVRYPAPAPANNANNNGASPARPAPVQTRYESPIAREQYSVDEDDGITLSPTFSEVSGLTMPTCLGTVNGDAGSRVTIQSDVFGDLSKPSKANGTLYHETMSPIARHRKQQEMAVTTASSGGKKIAKHPYLQRVNSTQSRGPEAPPRPSRNSLECTPERIHEMKTPRARGSPGLNNSNGSGFNASSQGIENNKPKSRREQIVAKVRASPRHKSLASFPQHTNNLVTNSKSRSQEEQNVIVENNISQSSSGDKSHFLHFDGRGGGGVANTKGRVAENVERVNRKMKKGQSQSSQPSRRSVDRNQTHGLWDDSLATTDCIRVD